MISRLSLAIALALTATVTPATPSFSEDAADLILLHGVVYPVAPPGRVAGGVAVRGGRIVYVGDDAGLLARRGPATRVIDLAGRAVTPGLIDAHSHLGGLGADLEQVDLRGAASFAEVVQRVRQAAAQRPAGAWVLGRGWDQNHWPGKQFPTHPPLSQAVPDRPVLLERIDGHAMLLNARAMELSGISAATRDPQGGRLLRDAAGQPTGVLLDRAMGLAHLPEPSPADLRRQLAAAARYCVERGLTTVTDMGIGQEQYEAYEAVRHAGQLPLRAALFIADQPQVLDRWFARGPQIDPDARITVRGVKMYADGALGSRGAALLEGYSDDPGNLGLVVTPSAHMEEVARRAVEHGFQVAIHAIGDRGSLLALDAMQAAMGGGPRPDLRFRLEHAQVLRLEDIQRMARLGIVASMQPTHATSDMGWAEDRLGAARLRGAYAWRKVLAAGGRLALGSDFPVESPDPRLGLYAAVTRQDLHGQPPGGWQPGERLTRDEALRGFTLDAAWSLFLDREVGSIEVGRRADLVVFGRDPMTVPEAEMAQAPIDLTLVDGKVVYARDAQGGAPHPRHPPKPAGKAPR